MQAILHTILPSQLIKPPDQSIFTFGEILLSQLWLFPNEICTFLCTSLLLVVNNWCGIDWRKCKKLTYIAGGLRYFRVLYSMEDCLAFCQNLSTHAMKHHAWLWLIEDLANYIHPRYQLPLQSFNLGLARMGCCNFGQPPLYGAYVLFSPAQTLINTLNFIETITTIYRLRVELSIYEAKQSLSVGDLVYITQMLHVLK